jgi:hypothetical protein
MTYKIKEIGPMRKSKDNFLYEHYKSLENILHRDNWHSLFSGVIQLTPIDSDIVDVYHNSLTNLVVIVEGFANVPDKSLIRYQYKICGEEETIDQFLKEVKE